jgi:hypothetical protein
MADNHGPVVAVKFSRSDFRVAGDDSEIQTGPVDRSVRPGLFRTRIRKCVLHVPENPNIPNIAELTECERASQDATVPELRITVIGAGLSA